jgi:hypothetical protein
MLSYNKNNNNIAVCVLCKIPNEEWLRFLNDFNKYDVFMIIDDNSTTYTEYSEKYKNINIIQIDNQDCYNKCYTNCNAAVEFPEVIAWDKSMYYFNEVNTSYEYVWLVEDDVFIYDENVLMSIDEKHRRADLLTAFHEINETGEMYSWSHWVNVIHRIELPWAHSMVCAMRVSKQLLMEIVKYKHKHGHLFFIESMFNTIAHQNNLLIENPVELSNIHWNTSWNRDDIDIKKLYHPFKNIDDHVYIRNNK